MYIGFYNCPINECIFNYKGLYRENNLIDYDNKNFMRAKELNWYLSNSIEGMFMEYKEINMPELISIYIELKNNEWRGELILFTDKINKDIPNKFELLGYDICADSRYYSPLGDGFLGEYNQEYTFYKEISEDDFLNYKRSINRNYLFNTAEAALSFSKYCNYINEKYPHAVESESGWRPFAIYKYNIDYLNLQEIV